jgi:hypothetical protein
MKPDNGYRVERVGIQGVRGPMYGETTSGVPSVLRAKLDKIGAEHTEDQVRTLLLEPDAPAAAPVLPYHAVNYAIC